MKVRRLKASEWKAFQELRLRALRADPLAFGSSFRREKAYPSDRWKSWADGGARGGEAATFVAEAEPGCLVGMAGVFTAGDEYHVWGMWVSPEFRNRGLGGRLFDRVLEWTQLTNPQREVSLEVNRDQASAFRLYEGRGFRATGKASPLGHHAPAMVHEMRRTNPSSVARRSGGKKRPARKRA